MTSGSSAGRMTPALCTTCVTAKRRGDIGGGLLGRGAIEQIDLDRMQPRMRSVQACERASEITS